MRFSVVINTYNRAASLRHTLLSLRQQTYADFEVIVVNGPSTDRTEEVLAEFAGWVRSLRCDVARLAVSRNIGINAAAGDVVAFIDDDSLATPFWLEELVEAYREPHVGGAGGLVYDPTGVALQWDYTACYRDGSVMKVKPPLEQYLHPFANPVAYLQGTNMSFSRAVLEEIGGFDEAIRHYYDDVDICLRVIDRGYKLRQLKAAAVHHKFLGSHVRDHKRRTLDPFNELSDRVYFGLKHGQMNYSLAYLGEVFHAEAVRLRQDADVHMATQALTQTQRDYVHRRVDEALGDGWAKGTATSRADRSIAVSRSGSFTAFPVLRPSGRRLRLCLLCREYPPGDFGGTGRYSEEFAAGFAAAGHEVHVITESPDVYRLDLVDGAWVHRLPPQQRSVPQLRGVASARHIFGMVGAYHEVCKIHAERPVDIVLSPLWLCEGLVCALDERFATAVTMITAMKAIAALSEWARISPEAQQLVRLEEELIHRARHLHAVSGAIRDRAVVDYGADPRQVFLAPLGMRDRSREYQRKRPADGRLRILYAGRLETRKGADVFLEALFQLGKEFPHTEFVLAGKELPSEQGDTYRQRFEARFRSDPEFRSRVCFTGTISDEQLFQHYADCDIFCLPSYCESFGLVYVEAMMWGKPLVGSRVGGVPEVVADGEQGFLCPVGDVDAVTASLRKLITDPELRTRLGRRSRELYEQKWELSRVVTHMAKELQMVLRHHQSTSVLEPTGPASRQLTTAQFAAILERTTNIGAKAARAAAARLLDPAQHQMDLSPSTTVRPCLRQRLARIPYVGTMLRRGKRLISLPWNLLMRPWSRF
jgi:glycogen(starch) synthase